MYLSLEAAQLPARVDAGEKVEDVLVEERIARLDRRVHGHAVPLGVEQVPGQMDAARPEERAVDRVPAFHAVEVRLQAVVGQVIA